MEPILECGEFPKILARNFFDELEKIFVWTVKKYFRTALTCRRFMTAIASEMAQSEKVRVIEFDVKLSSKEPERYRLITTLDHTQATLDELAELYHERWEYENTNKEQKRVLNAHLDGLRSKTPTLVIQELIGLFLAHFATRSFMHEAALSANIDVDRLSFKHSVSVIRRRAPQVGAFPP